MSADRFQDWLDRGSPWTDPHENDAQLDIYDVVLREVEDEKKDEIDEEKDEVDA